MRKAETTQRHRRQHFPSPLRSGLLTSVKKDDDKIICDRSAIDWEDVRDVSGYTRVFSFFFLLFLRLHQGPILISLSTARKPT